MTQLGAPHQGRMPAIPRCRSWSVAQTGDFNGDGNADILWHNTNGDTSIWLMTGTSMQVQVLSATDLGVVATSWNVPVTGDFNSDGKSDILWRNTNGDTSIWFINGALVSLHSYCSGGRREASSSETFIFESSCATSVRLGRHQGLPFCAIVEFCFGRSPERADRTKPGTLAHTSPPRLSW
jgi:hypothetical protein